MTLIEEGKKKPCTEEGHKRRKAGEKVLECCPVGIRLDQSRQAADR